MEKMKMHSPNLIEKNITKLADLFPNCVTESTGVDGALMKTVDFDLLRQELSCNLVEGVQERYHLDWPGKREALHIANAPIFKTLRPCLEESVDFDRTQNIFIEGDNLDALKLLQETYLDKVKVIYIDPPYNTGKDFIYSDNFTAEKEGYAIRSGSRDEERNKLIDEENWKQNMTSNGRFHSDWLSMMFSRLKLARNLLRDDGVIYISIDDGEVGNLRKLSDQVFGEGNFIANVIWQKKYTRANDAKWFSDNHDHVLCYAKNKQCMTLNMLPRNDAQLAAYSNPDNHKKGVWKATPLHAKSGSNTSPYIFRNGSTWQPPKGTYRRFNDASMKKMDETDEIWFGTDSSHTPSRKSFLCDVKSGVTPVTLWPYDEVGHTHEANNELKALNLGGFFDNPKPTRLLKRAIILASDKHDIILDFFAGSATTAHAVMQLNAEDGGNRKFIMVQLPEACDEKSEAYKAGYTNIAEISRERIRRAGKKIKEENATNASNIDIGFRVLKIDSSNMSDVYYTPDAIDQNLLSLLTDNIKSDRTSEDLLFQILLDWGVDLSLPVTKEEITEKEVFFVDNNALAACFIKNGQITEDFCKELAKRQPMRVIFRDSGFKDDSVKINAEQIFKLMSPHTDVKTI